MPIHLFCLNTSLKGQFKQRLFQPRMQKPCCAPVFMFLLSPKLCLHCWSITALYMQDLVQKWKITFGSSHQQSVLNIIKFTALWLGLKWRQTEMSLLLVLEGISQQFLSKHWELELQHTRHWAEEPVPGFLIKTGGFAFSLACVLFEKRLKISGLGSTKELH